MTTDTKAVARWDCKISSAYGGFYIEKVNDDHGPYVLFADHERVLGELRAQIEALLRDAKRYAWLRSRAGQKDGAVEIFIQDESYSPGHLDAQVDEAMAAMKEQAE